MNDVIAAGARRTVVQGHRMAEATRDRLDAGVRERLPAGSDRPAGGHLDFYDEEGAQVAEYAMLGGVAAAACGGLITLLTKGDIIERIMNAIVNALVGLISSWF